MKNIFYKLFYIFLFFLISIYSVNALTDQTLLVKLSTSPNGDYNDTSIDVINNNDTILNFKVLTVMEPMGTGSYSIAFPTGFELISNSLTISDPSCIGNNITNIGNTTFEFNITAIGTFCVYENILTYKVKNTVTEGTKQISVINTATSGINHSVNIGITSQNTLTKAETVDSDSNGFIDKYKLTFSTGGLTNFSNINLKVGVLTPTLGSILNNIAYIVFNNNTYGTSEKPQLTDTDGGIFSGIGIISELTISEEDKASPVILSINGTNVVGVANPSIDISQNSKLVINFSEGILSSSLLTGFTITENGVNITNSNYITFNESNGNTMYYCLGGYDGNLDCINNFDSNKTYQINISNTVVDLNSNTYNGGAINIGINVTDSTPPISNSVTYNSETNNAIVINGNASNNNYTNNSAGTVNLSIGANDNSSIVSQMCISNNALSNNNVCDTGWKAYSTSNTFTFTGAEGIKTLYIKFKDSAGNISAVFSDSIIWDKTNPTSTAIPNGGSFINGSQNVTLNCSDAISNCTVIYYTIDGSVPTTSSTSVTSGTNISLTGNNETITVKFFTKDIANNQEGITNSKNFIFSNSYVTFTTPISITNNSSLTLNGTCNNAGGLNAVEYSLNGGAFGDVTVDDCDTTNTWSTDLILLTNQINTIQTRIKANTSITTNISVIHDSISPSSTSISINNGDTYSDSTNVNLNISANDANGTNKMCITEFAITNDNICTSSAWENYGNTKAFVLSSTQGSKTVYIKFKDEAGNISSVKNDTIILVTSTPTISANLVSGNYTGVRLVTLTSSDTIYYTTNGTNPTNLSTLYTGPLSFGSTIGTTNLKAIAYGNSGISSSINSYTYVFGCFPSTVNNGTVASYPSCVITCNSGYNLSGSSCVQIVSSGGGGSSSGGGGATEITDYENLKFISSTKIPLIEQVINKIFNKYGILDISGLSNKQLTGNDGIIKLRSALKGLSNLIISANTMIIGDAKLIYAPYSIEIKKDLKLDDLMVNNVSIKTFNIKKLFFLGNNTTPVSFDKDIDINFDLGGIIDGTVNVYSSNSIDGNFKLVEKGLETNKDGIISFKTKQLGYFIIIRDIYINRYFGNQVISTKEINTKLNTEKLVTELKNTITNTGLNEFIDKYSIDLIIPEMDYYISFDSELQNKYSSILKGFTDFILNTDKFLTTKDSQYQILAANAFNEYIKVTDLKNFDDKYIIKTQRDGLEIYKTTYTPIAHLVDALENAMLVKLKKLLDANTISQSKYDQTIKDYNDFILHLSIYRQYKIKAAAYKALIPGRAFLKVYKMNVVYKTVESNTPTPATEEKITIKENKTILIKDKYSFTKELKLGDYNDQVQNLQEIMKSYGYFTYPQTTMYFGSVTQNSLINFSKNILNTPNPDGILTTDLIQKLYLIEYKN